MASTQEIAAGLRAAADWLENHPDACGDVDAYVNFRTSSDANPRATLVALARELPGPIKKDGSGETFWLRGHFAKDVDFYAFISRAMVCTKRTKKITRKVYEYPEGVEPIVRKVESEVEEWDCPDSILAGVPDA